MFNMTMTKKTAALSALVIVAFLLAPVNLLSADDFPVDTIIEKVVSNSDPEETYALYLPPGYTPDKEFPLLLAFDPAARGSVPLQQFIEAARKYGYIIMGSNSSKNGPWGPTKKSIIAMWTDAHERLGVDKNRIYATGFSGGARVSSTLAYMQPAHVKGIILCGAGFSQDVKPEALKNTFVIGVIGSKDFNYREVQGLEETTRKIGIPYATMYYDGFHTWSSPEDSMRAIEWLEVRAMATGLKDKNPELIDSIYKKEFDIASGYETGGNLIWAWDSFNQLKHIFDGVHDSADAEKKMKEIEAKPDYSLQRAHDKKLLDNERQHMVDTRKIFGVIVHNNLMKIDYRKILAGLKIPEMNKTVETTSDFFENRSAVRTLVRIYLDTQSAGEQMLTKEDLDRAEFFFRLAMEAAPHTMQWYKISGHFNLAAVYSQQKKPEYAVKHLRLSYEAGLKNPVNLTLKYFDPIRDDEKFKALEAEMKTAYAASKSNGE